MKKWIAVILLLSISIALAGSAALAEAKEPLNIEVKQLRSAPMEDANLVFDIPCEVRLLDVSADGNWYKVKIAFYIGPFGYTYVGWTYLPTSEILAKRDNLASTPEN